ncbi:MAG: molecular chaperone TorD family protein [Coriobacteriales bacterium]|nr:molecular chaperone TorD family protein [Coriobacteriales bacterium]
MADEALLGLATLCRQRAATYGLLARLFRVEVDQPLLNELHSSRYPASTGNSLVDEGYRDIATYLSNADERSVTELAVDYTRTFIGYGVDAYSAAFPFESVYTSEKRLKMQDARDEVLAIYHAYALDKDESWEENEDHLAVELEFMQVMCSRAASALEAGDEDRAVQHLEVQRGFLADHLNAWVPMFTSDIARISKTSFYKGLGKLCEGYLQEDAVFLDGILDES